MPRAEALPDALAGLVRRHAFSLGNSRWRADVLRLIETIERFETREVPTPANVQELEPQVAATNNVALDEQVRVFLVAELHAFVRHDERRDETVRRLIERFTALLRRDVELHAGQVVEMRDDEASAVFAGARAALQAAAELESQAIADTQRDPTMPWGVSIGLDAGDATLADERSGGRALDIARELKRQARAGQALATDAVIHLAGPVDGLSYADRGFMHLEYPLRGLATPVRVVEVRGEVQTRTLTSSTYEPELRSFMYADAVGYAALVVQHGDAAAADFQTLFGQIIAERVHARDGQVLDQVGDSALAVFVSPRQAIWAAIELLEDLEHAVKLELQFPITLRIGVETGEAIPVTGKYVGSVVNLTALICGLAGPGEVVIGEAVCHLVRRMDGIAFIDRGQAQLRGFADPVRVMRAMREYGSSG
jgi:class 3 adenylate cyclase